MHLRDAAALERRTAQMTPETSRSRFSQMNGSLFGQATSRLARTAHCGSLAGATAMLSGTVNPSSKTKSTRAAFSSLASRQLTGQTCPMAHRQAQQAGQRMDANGVNDDLTKPILGWQTDAQDELPSDTAQMSDAPSPGQARPDSGRGNMADVDTGPAPRRVAMAKRQGRSGAAPLGQGRRLLNQQALRQFGWLGQGRGEGQHDRCAWPSAWS